MEKPHYYRYHGLGNDYLVIHPEWIPFAMTPERARLICDRNFGVGSDGILLGPLYHKGKADIHLKIINPDGSEAEKSGNGVRIFSRFLHEEKIISAPEFSFFTPGGRVSASIEDTDYYRIRVNMGKYEIHPPDVPVDPRLFSLPENAIINEEIMLNGEKFSIAVVSMGNPHCVVFTPEASEEYARKWGPVLENHPAFPNRTNVQFVKSDKTERGRLEIFIWERGAGYTLASGSSSCAASVASFLRGLVNPRVNVVMPGGMLEIQVDENSREVWMTGPVASIGFGFFSEEMLRGLSVI